MSHPLRQPSADAQFQARLAASTSEVARLAAIATHPRTRAAIVSAKMDLQDIAREGRGADAGELAFLFTRLEVIDTTLQAVSRAIDAFGAGALLPLGVKPDAEAGTGS